MENEKNTGATPEVETENTAKTEDEKMYSEKELQSEVDRRLTQALKTVEKKNQAKLKEAEKLAQMNEQEKYEYQLQQRENAIAEKEKALALAENKNEASRILAEKGISLNLVEFVVAEDAETMMANIGTLEREFKASVKAEVEKRMGSTSPKKNLVEVDTMTKEKLLAMPMPELQRLINENPNLQSILK